MARTYGPGEEWPRLNHKDLEARPLSISCELWGYLGVSEIDLVVG